MVLITGAGTGIGGAIAIELARYGCIILAYAKEDELAEPLGEVRKHAPDSTAEVCDVSDESRVKQMVQASHQRHGSISIPVNNAGTIITRFFMDVNFFGTGYLARAVVPIMK